MQNLIEWLESIKLFKMRPEHLQLFHRLVSSLVRINQPQFHTSETHL